LASDQPHAELTQGQRRSRGKIVFVFPGQGSQWATMGAELLRDSAAFRQAVDACDAALKPWVSYSVLSVLRGDPEGPSLERVEVVQPTLFAMSIGLVAAWRALGLNPSAVVGHSQGEIAAAVVAGALSLAEGAKIVALRSQLLSRVKHRGGMAVLALSVSQASERIARFGGALSLAVVNTPSSTVVAGDITAIDALIAELGVGCVCQEGERGLRLAQRTRRWGGRRAGGAHRDVDASRG
jgi:acyl transferase domain-containing protein